MINKYETFRDSKLTIPEMLTPFSKIVCNWRPLKEAIDFINKGIDEKDINQKWKFYGDFVGKFIEATTQSVS